LSLRLGGRFFIRNAVKMLANLLGHIDRNRARVRLLFCYAVPGQQVDDRLCLNLEFAGQFVNSYLIWVCRHESLGICFFRMLFLAAFFRGLCMLA
jgi:hypothetical protein